MNSLTITVGGAAPEPASITSLHQRFGEGWAIAYQPDLEVWSAERRSPDGLWLRLICDRNSGALAAKLAVAEAGQ
jgi:hypothetical protein